MQRGPIHPARKLKRPANSDLAEKVIAMTGSRSHIVHHALPQDAPKQRRPDISQAQEVLDWRPTVTLTEGLQRTIAYFERLLSAAGTPAFAEAAERLSA